MLSIDQKESTLVAVKKSYTVATKVFTPRCIYSWEVPTTYPYIMLNYIDEEYKDQNAVGDYIGTLGSNGQRSYAVLSVNIEAKDAQGLNANNIASDIARQLSIDIHQNWGSLSSGTVKFKRKSETRNLTHVNQAANIIDVARYQFDIFLMYDHAW